MKWFILTILFLIISLFWLAMLRAPRPTTQSQMDLDHQTCQQLREAGWTEYQIKQFMDDFEGYYDEGIT